MYHHVLPARARHTESTMLWLCCCNVSPNHSDSYSARYLSIVPFFAATYLQIIQIHTQLIISLSPLIERLSWKTGICLFIDDSIAITLIQPLSISRALPRARHHPKSLIEFVEFHRLWVHSDRFQSRSWATPTCFLSEFVIGVGTLSVSVCSARGFRRLLVWIHFSAKLPLV